MRTAKPMLFIATLFLASFLIAPNAFADACINAVNKASDALNDKGGTCKKKVASFKSAAAAAHRYCRFVRDRIRACWAVYRSRVRNECDKLPVAKRTPCRMKHRKTRSACIDKVKANPARATCSDKRKYATKMGLASMGACGAPVVAAARTCSAHWVGVFLKAFLGN